MLITNSISIRAALAGCDSNIELLYRETDMISIHAALAGCDDFVACLAYFVLGFQSTQPSRAATRCLRASLKSILISIHAALAGCDSQMAQFDIKKRQHGIAFSVLEEKTFLSFIFSIPKKVRIA